MNKTEVQDKKKKNDVRLTTNMRKLVAAKIMKSKPWRVLSRIIQLRTSNGDSGEGH